ncbi:MAG: cytochrome c family protein [Alphaproteobacteria bacterium]
MKARTFDTSAALILAAVLLAVSPSTPRAAGDAERGREVFRACAACHSLKPNDHRTGPSLTGIVGRKAGTAEGFRRYSEALEAAHLIWDDESLDAFLVAPQSFLPGNRMTFQGLPDADARADLIAYLEQASDWEGSSDQATRDGMMAEPARMDLKAMGPEGTVTAIGYCDDTYEVTTAFGETIPFWEFNLRFKTDSGDMGPPPGKPALLAASMMGDRAFVIFADPNEISTMIEKRCDPRNDD